MHVAKFLYPADEYSVNIKDSGKYQPVLFQICNSIEITAIKVRLLISNLKFRANDYGLVDELLINRYLDYETKSIIPYSRKNLAI